MDSIFKDVTLQPEDPIFGLTTAFQQDPRSEKVNLGIGSYKDAQGKTRVLSCVREAEQRILEKELDKNYLPILGAPDYIQQALDLIFGPLSSKPILGVQSPGGTGALRIGAEFLSRCQLSQEIYLSDPTWANHLPVFRQAGLNTGSYSYYDRARRGIDFPRLLDSIRSIPPGSAVLLHPCCHNPTGMTPEFQEWKELSALMLQRRLIPFFDLAYQGFDRGLEEDAEVVRYFVSEGHQMLVASSYSKNFGLYAERVGLLAVVCAKPEEIRPAASHIKQLVRWNYSNPPLHGQRIVAAILESEELRKQWEAELKEMRDRIQAMRTTLADVLDRQDRSERFHFLRKQAGMFSYSGLNSAQVLRIQKEFGIYMTSDGRINVAGLTGSNIPYVAKAILAVSGE